MIGSKEEMNKLFRSVVFGVFYHHECEYCNKDIVFDTDSCETILFEPKEEGLEYFWYENNGKERIRHSSIKPTLVSSDPNKDIFRYKCPICGHINEITREDLGNMGCVLDGKQHDIFVLDEVETLKARTLNS